MGRDIDLDLADRKRVAERDQLVGLLGRHDAGDAGGAKHVAFLGVAGRTRSSVVAAHPHEAFGDRDPLGCRLLRYVDHAGVAAGVDMGEVAGHGSADGRGAGGFAGEEGACRRGHVGLPHQAFADEEGRMLAAASRAMSAGVKMPLSPTATRSRGNSGASRRATSSVVIEGLQVAVVDADQPRFRAAARARARPRCGPRRARPCRNRALRLELARGGVVDRRHDDEDAVGAQARASAT